MKNSLLVLTIVTVAIFNLSCKKDSCQNCYQIVGGFAKNDTVATREVCDNEEAFELEHSSSGTTFWTCEKEKLNRYEWCGTK